MRPLPDTTGHADPASDATDRGRHGVSCRARLDACWGHDELVAAFTRKHSQGRLHVGLGWCLCNPRLRARAAEFSFSGNAVPFRRTIRGASMCPTTAALSSAAEHPRRRSLVTAGQRGQPPARDAGPDVEPKAAILLCRVEPEAASASSGRLVAAPGRPTRQRADPRAAAGSQSLAKQPRRLHARWRPLAAGSECVHTAAEREASLVRRSP